MGTKLTSPYSLRRFYEGKYMIHGKLQYWDLRSKPVTVALALLMLIVWGYMHETAYASACYGPVNLDHLKPVMGKKFMIASAHPLASQAGCEVLQNGGNAVDAAIAAQMVLAVVEPQSSGLAGGTMITYWDNINKKVRFFEGLAKAPQHVTADIKTPTEDDINACGVKRFKGRVNNTGRAFGVPGTLRVLDMVHGIYGQKSWDRLFDAAIDLAETGYAMTPYMHTVLGELATANIPRCKFADLQSYYCLDDTTPKPVGTMLVNHELAETLRIVRNGGADAFYDPHGDIVPKIIERVTAGPCAPVSAPAIIPSLMTAQDFAAYEARERQPICESWSGKTICTAAPPSFGGTALIYMLNLMSRGGIEAMNPNTFDWAHLFIESSHLAQIDRRQYIGDPDFNPIPVASILDQTYLDARFSLYAATHALVPVEHGLPLGVTTVTTQTGGDQIDGSDTTSQISIVDQYGNALSMTTTVNASFGAQMLAAGMVLNNVQDNFTRFDSISPGIPVNVMESDKKPRTAFAPTLIFDAQGRVELVIGSAGGSGIPDYIAQTILNLYAHGMNLQRAINRGHVSGQAITTINGERQLYSELESGTRMARFLDQMIAAGHPAARATPLRSGLAAVQIKYNRKGKILELKGATDRRRDGIAVSQ
jgi:gamma-glutamyltranspeptidase/glutathione hydrolase